MLFEVKDSGVEWISYSVAAAIVIVNQRMLCDWEISR